MISASSCDIAENTYKAVDEKYQKAQDPIRIRHVDEIANIAIEYAAKTGKAPLQELSENENSSFLAIIGRSVAEEDHFGELEVLSKGALFVNSKLLEEQLSQGLGRKIILPRDPQKVATFAPNAYLYLYSSGQICVAAHLFEPSAISVRYKWEHGEFHSHGKCFSRET